MYASGLCSDTLGVNTLQGRGATPPARESADEADHDRRDGDDATEENDEMEVAEEQPIQGVIFRKDHTECPVRSTRVGGFQCPPKPPDDWGYDDVRPQQGRFCTSRFSQKADKEKKSSDEKYCDTHLPLLDLRS